MKQLIKKNIHRVYRYLSVKVSLPRIYRQEARKSIDERKVLFVVPRYETLPAGLSYVHRILEESRQFDIHVHYLRSLTLQRFEKYAVAKEFIRDLGTAKYLFMDEANEQLSGFDKRPETKVVQLWHGCGAFKKFGFSTADKIFGETAKQQRQYNFYKNCDVVTVSSPEVVWAYEEAMQLEGQNVVKPLGISRTDQFIDPAFVESAKQRVLDAIGDPDKKIILYAPTFRGRVAEAVGPDPFDYDALFEHLSDDYVLLVKHHPLVKELPEIPAQYKDSFIFDVTRSLDIEDLLCAADICISDYSSLTFEYSLFNRPLILFAYDLDEYDDWRGFYYDFDDYAAGPVLKTTDELIDYIEHVGERYDQERMDAFRERFMSSCDGHATERIFKEIGLSLTE